MSKNLPLVVKKYYESAPPPHRTTMLEMRKRILEVVPNAEEVVSYGMPAFRVNGNVIAGLLNNKKHVGYYPFSGSVLSSFKKELSVYSQTKSAIHVPVDKPLPKSLIRKLIRARLSQCEVVQGKVDLAKYEKLDGEWKKLGLAAPARRALVNAEVLKLIDLKKLSEKEFLALHGMGPSASKLIEAEMKRKKISFKK